MSSKKIILGLAVLLIIIGAWWVISNKETTMTFSIDNEIAELEAELEAIERDIADGLITPQVAAEAQIRIMNRISAISDITESVHQTGITPAQRAMLLEGLNRLRTVLARFQDTLVAIDAEVATLPEDQRPVLHIGRGASRTFTSSIVAVVEDAVNSIEEVVEESVNDVNDVANDEVEVNDANDVANDEVEVNDANDENGEEANDTNDENEVDESNDSEEEEEE